MHPVGVGLVKLQDGGYKERACSDDRASCYHHYTRSSDISEKPKARREVNALFCYRMFIVCSIFGSAQIDKCCLL